MELFLPYRDQLTINNKKKQKKSKKLKILGHDGGSQEENLTLDEKTAIQLYAATRKGKMKHLDESEDDSDDGAHENEQQEQDMVSTEKSGTEPGDLEESEDRRGITYQIFKNKGLAPKRNKDQRNPRVKHRHKFEKAKVRRKGQVRTPRTETKKYSGEQSGINMRVKKGVKLM
jgi:U3 small nucleolar RNA-associated protein 3